MKKESIISQYEAAKERFAELGVDTDAAMDALDATEISMHCWQGDDVIGFEGSGQELSGGILTTGNYPGRARNAEELRADYEKAFSLIPGKKRANLHEFYLETGGKFVDRDEVEVKYFENWMQWAKEQGINLDIAGKLKSLLEEYGAVVEMTREDENAVASTKEEDMHTRERIIREAAADAVLSVHQNRYSDTSVRGPQVFFFRAGTPAQRLADCVQRALNDGLAPAKKRSAQSADYLLLRAGAAPCITVECAFLSNPDDEALLQSDAYREKIARCIAQGVSEFFLQDRSIAV